MIPYLLSLRCLSVDGSLIAHTPFLIFSKGSKYRKDGVMQSFWIR
jgi:hypothetical protein